MTLALVALGTNLGDRQANLDRAVQLLAAAPGVRLLAVSRPRATRPVGGPSGQADFLNAAALFETSLEPVVFFAVIQEIETALGRQREGPRWGPRPIDLDLLLYGSLVFESADLTIPHPRMAFRRFVVEPAAEVAPTMLHPAIGWTLAELHEHLRTAPPYAAIAGAPYAGKSRLAVEVSRLVGAQFLRDPAAGQSMEAGPTGTAGPGWERQIELLESRASQLSGAISAEKEPHVRVVSDYWFAEALCFAAIEFPPERVEEFGRRWQEASAVVPREKLLTLLDAPVDWLWDRALAAERPSWLDLEALGRVRQAIVDRATEPGRGPLLRLDARQPDNARIELAAAIEAMNG